MPKTNFERMIQLATDAFAAHSDPNQLDVDEEVIKQLQKLHTATVSEYIDGDGPVVWVIIIPTTESLMKQFINEEISETELLNKTPLNIKYNAIYLCSAMVLEEFRRKGLAKSITLNAINTIRKEYIIHSLFTWNFSKQGALLAKKIAEEVSLPLFERNRLVQ